MWTVLIIVSAPSLHLLAGVAERLEPALVQAFIPQAAVEMATAGQLKRQECGLEKS